VSGITIDLSGRGVIVAGAGGGGIGTAVCELLVAAGARVTALDVDASRLESVPAAVRHVVDVRSPQAVNDVVGEAESLWGLVHVAGGTRPEQWERTERVADVTFEDVVALNLNAALTTSQAVASRLIDTGSGGSIVHLASTAGLSSLPFGAAYAAAKAGMLALMRTQAVEWGRYGVRVNAIAAGSVRTPKNARETTDDAADVIPLRRRGEPIDIARAVLFLLSDLAAWITGHTLVADGGVHARPSFLDSEEMPVFVRDAELRARLRAP
jgi:NAD(P)-dependent dehydrogenase (short-subunit alcohol dehydrogenase family)